MINFRINITLPLLLVILIGVIAWLVRDAGSSSTPARKPAPRRPRRRPRQTIIHRDGQDNGVTYEEALRAPAGTYTADDLRDLADQEARDTARTAYSHARAAQMPNPLRRRQS